MGDFIRIDLYNFYYAEGILKYNKNILYVEIGFIQIRIIFSISISHNIIQVSNVISDDGKRMNLKYYNNDYKLLRTMIIKN
jgi:hypothetical protein